MTMSYPGRSRPRLTIVTVLTLAGMLGAVGVVNAAAAAVSCRIAYAVTNQWSGGFGASVTVHNLGDPLDGWRLVWTFGAGQTVTQLWNGTFVQSGGQVTVADAGYNGAIPTNGSTAFGFNGGWNSVVNPVPASFALNGVTCTGAPAPTTPPPTGTPPPTSGPTTAPTTAPTRPPGTPPAAYPGPGGSPVTPGCTTRPW